MPTEPARKAMCSDCKGSGLILGLKACACSPLSPFPKQPTMWETHTHGDKPSHTCAACWAEAYDADSAKCAANLKAIGYPPPPFFQRSAPTRTLRHTEFTHTPRCTAGYCYD